jgi:hypothetical protein
MKIGDRVSFMDGQRREVGTLMDFQELSDEAVIETDDGLTHIVPCIEIEQRVERLPESELPSFESTGIRQ